MSVVRRQPGQGIQPPKPANEVKSSPKASYQFKLVINRQLWLGLTLIFAISLILILVKKTGTDRPERSTQATNRLASLGRKINLTGQQSTIIAPIPVKKTGYGTTYAPARQAILVDLDSQSTLYELNPDQPVAVASTTKLATALTIRKLWPEIETKVTISQRAASQSGSLANLKAGQVFTIRELLYALLMMSGNDAAVALAEVSDPEQPKFDRFIESMNQTAREYGATNTHFADPAGLNDLQGRSTARDLARLMAATIADPVLKEIISTDKLDLVDQSGQLVPLENSNRLVTGVVTLPGIIGGKTGFTPLTTEGGAGHCLVIAATRDNHTLIATILGAYSVDKLATAKIGRDLVNWGYASYDWLNLN
ncbi:MAG: D-alanyl-D-alanine carboxypeptidase (penicillin-binding protein 5/6) [Candidatus Berkelbacteria bacterium Gr01-1014_85]|uniref:D-alanyl-D-alanine carboxypeptidase (Penicillin-binding protein 5/6) n=1 Tax=Candidatus Berkelbacteria bacterium Gr01-1014_85 TaxID=2017150 RepID=A0A554JD44_9BACT|nr:MAG: D-alanyl-D-alanine carboxypeptidase (penicillin-binding protein 5/6) [Candidatus Berkelbacteria bacterium Gr01-1014_85]